MFTTILLSLAFHVTLGLAGSQLITNPQYFQDNGNLSPLPEERSVNVLSVQLPQSKPEPQPIIQVKPVYIPVPIKDIQVNQLPYHAYQPNYVTFVSQKPTTNYQQHSQNQNQNQNIKPNPNPSPLQHISALPDKYPWIFTSNEFSEAENPNYIAAPQIPVFFNNAETQLPQLTQFVQFPQKNPTNTQSVFQFLPQMFNGLTFYNAPMNKQKILAEADNVPDKSEHDQTSTKPMNNIKEANIKPNAMDSNIIFVPDVIPSTDYDIQNTKKISNTNLAPETNLLLQNLLQKLNSQRRVQERIGAIYLRDSILNRK